MISDLEWLLIDTCTFHKLFAGILLAGVDGRVCSAVQEGTAGAFANAGIGVPWMDLLCREDAFGSAALHQHYQVPSAGDGHYCQVLPRAENQQAVGAPPLSKKLSFTVFSLLAERMKSFMWL